MKLLQASTTALVLVLGLATAANAQVTLNGVAVPANELESVTDHCEALAAAEREQAAEPIGVVGQGQGDGETNPNGEGDKADTTDGQGIAVAGATDLTKANDAASAQTASAGQIDLDTVTLEACQAGGFIQATN